MVIVMYAMQLRYFISTAVSCSPKWYTFSMLLQPLLSKRLTRSRSTASSPLFFSPATTFAPLPSATVLIFTEIE